MYGFSAAFGCRHGILCGCRFLPAPGAFTGFSCCRRLYHSAGLLSFLLLWLPAGCRLNWSALSCFRFCCRFCCRFRSFHVAGLLPVVSAVFLPLACCRFLPSPVAGPACCRVSPPGAAGPAGVGQGPFNRFSKGEFNRSATAPPRVGGIPGGIWKRKPIHSHAASRRVCNYVHYMYTRTRAGAAGPGRSARLTSSLRSFTYASCVYVFMCGHSSTRVRPLLVCV